MCVRGLGEGGAGLGWLTAVAFWDSLWHGAIINVVVTYTWSFPARTSQNLRRERRLFQTSVDPLTAAHIPPLMQSWVLILPFVPALHGDLHACCVFEEITSFQVQIPQHCCKRRPHHYTIFFFIPHLWVAHTTCCQNVTSTATSPAHSFLHRHRFSCSSIRRSNNDPPFHLCTLYRERRCGIKAQQSPLNQVVKGVYFSISCLPEIQPLPSSPIPSPFGSLYLSTSLFLCVNIRLLYSALF